MTTVTSRLRNKSWRLALLLVLAGCSAQSLSSQELKSRCLDFADAVSRAQLSTTPNEKLARDVADSLDNKLSRLGSPAVHDPAVKLHQALHAIEVAQRNDRTDQANEATARARENIDKLAKACDLPSSRFLGQP